MANEDYLRILSQGVQEWNAWRRNNRKIKLDFSRADLSCANLMNADLKGVNLCSAILTGANLRGANLEDADLSSANLEGADLMKADLTGADLRDANLRDIDFRIADLANANLSRVNLRNAIIIGARLTEVNLGHADLRRAVLSDADLRYADLRGADLSLADLSEAILENAKFARTVHNNDTKGLDGLNKEQRAGLFNIGEEEAESVDSPLIEESDRDIQPDETKSDFESGDDGPGPLPDIEPTTDTTPGEGHSGAATEIVRRVVIYERRLIDKQTDLRLVDFFLANTPNTFESDEIADAYRALQDLVRDLLNIIDGQREEIAALRMDVDRTDTRIGELEGRLSNLENELVQACERGEPFLRNALQTSVNTAAKWGTAAVIGTTIIALARILDLTMDDAFALIKLIK